MNVVDLRERHSAYAGSTADWTIFMDCWRTAASELHADQIASESDHETVLGRLSLDGPAGIPEVRARDDLAKLERRLGVILPKSYKDFWVAYKTQRFAPQRFSSENWLGSVGMLELEEVGFFKDLEPEYWSQLQDAAPYTDNSPFFSYGVGQDNGARTSGYGQAILIGKYTDHGTDLILLHPELKTIDGEMQASLNEWAGQFCAPSFAELMRQLSILETVKVDHVPPYPQGMLAGRCAAKLPMRSVWWD
ncbi:SMI1/KNR4 family protein [Variovorax paradoxus]|uniref:SMI1/KNR4 family protein n=1 Tax=Variovorax paradoxus TaxID=34073 RepID=UPI003D64D2F8